MRHLVATCIVALAACDSPSTPAPPVCTQADTGSPCATTSATAVIEKGDWVVTFPTTVVKEIPYVENGVQCVRTSTTCVTTTCVVGPASSMTQDAAIAWCRRR